MLLQPTPFDQSVCVWGGGLSSGLWMEGIKVFSLIAYRIYCISG